MSKLLSILLLANMITHVQAMENPTLDLLQETDEEFITRAKEKCEYIARIRVAKARENEDGWWDRVYCQSYWSEPALKVEYSQGNQGACSIVVSDSNNRDQLQTSLARVNRSLAQFCSKTKHFDVRHIGLSADARLMGLFKNPIATNYFIPSLRGNHPLQEVFQSEDIITVYKIEAADLPKEMVSFQVADSLSAIAGIEFNNQATKIAVFGRAFSKSDSIPTNVPYSTEHNHIFTLDSSVKLK